MEFGSLPLSACEGAILAHSVAVADGRLSKGKRLGADELQAARAAGHQQLVVARPAPDDVREDDACRRIGEALLGEGLTLSPPAQGRVDLLAAGGGLFDPPGRTVDGVNRVNEGIGLAALEPWTQVAAGEVVATLKIVPFALGEPLVARAEEQAAKQPLSVRALQPLSVRLLQTRTETVTEKMLVKTGKVTRNRVKALGGEFRNAGTSAHDADALAKALRGASEDIVLISGASATTDRRDVVPSAIRAAGGRIERLGMPVDPGNLLLLAYRGEQAIIGMPGCARSPKRNGFDFVLERLFAGVRVRANDIAKMGLGGLLKGSKRPSR